MKPAPLITVVTVVRNAASVIQETLDSVTGQEFKDCEYVVLDGASTDGTAEIVRRHAPHLAYFHSKPDGGIYEAMNRALDIARGEYVYFLNAGDRLHLPNTLEKVASRLGGGCDFFTGRVRMMSDQGEDLQSHYPEEGPSFDQLWRSCCISHQASFLRRSILQSLGGFDTTLQSSADYDLWFRLSRIRPRSCFSMDVIAWYRVGGLSSHRRTRTVRNLEDVEILHRHHVIGPGAAAVLRLLRGHPPLRRRVVRWFGKIVRR